MPGFIVRCCEGFVHNFSESAKWCDEGHLQSGPRHQLYCQSGGNNSTYRGEKTQLPIYSLPFVGVP